MAHQQRLSISIDERRAAEIRKLVEAGSFRTVSAAFEEAATILIEQEAERRAWWAETVRRCQMAEEHPERLMGADAFFTAVKADIDGLRKSRSGGK